MIDVMTQAHLRQHELRRFGGDHQVGYQGHLHAGAYCIAANAADHRLGHGRHREEQGQRQLVDLVHGSFAACLRVAIEYGRNVVEVGSR